MKNFLLTAAALIAFCAFAIYLFDNVIGWPS